MIATARRTPPPAGRRGRPARSRRDQSIAHGPVSTTTPARPRAAATQRRAGIASCNTSKESGTTNNVVVLASTAVRPAGTQATARWVKKKNSASWEHPDGDDRWQVGAPREAHPTEAGEQDPGADRRKTSAPGGEPER